MPVFGMPVFDAGIHLDRQATPGGDSKE